ncbi:hypothetical protein chiPu_0015087 [Chiloscyllium punctatum]|uniref:Uncharacterized protein n=1 Tax=Chiloscyllium punctatum TaxID=137246 RepID=A0A401T1P8_CHIPU|nr:hypothetical protein [Chiloscyllium punctatum]
MESAGVSGTSITTLRLSTPNEKRAAFEIFTQETQNNHHLIDRITHFTIRRLLYNCEHGIKPHHSKA